MKINYTYKDYQSYNECNFSNSKPAKIELGVHVPRVRLLNHILFQLYSLWNKRDINRNLQHQ